MPSFFEFFAGGGMARAGLAPAWDCRFANDLSAMKAAAYIDNWGAGHFHLGDVAAIHAHDLPDGRPDLVWASTPCQDLSLAGEGGGLGKPDQPTARSGAFWPWWRLMQDLIANGRKPTTIVFENVVGALSSNGGDDFTLVAGAFAAAGYRLGAVVLDARTWLPQSRPRLFVVAFDRDQPIPAPLTTPARQSPWHTAAVQSACDRLPTAVRDAWVWWALPHPLHRPPSLDSLIDREPSGVGWRSAIDTARLVAIMSPANMAKLAAAQALGQRRVGCVYKRTRPAPDGRRHVRAEVRFDGVAGCLRTPSGGSSRQTIIVVEGASVRSRLLSPREAARLMGLPDAYRLPANYNDAYHLCGDGVAVPVVAFLARNLLDHLAAVGPAGSISARQAA